MSTDLVNIAGIFKTNTDLFKRVIQDIPAERWFKAPGDDSNHLLWIAGHVVVHRAMALKSLGQEWSAPWQELFLRGATRVEAEKYPAMDELVKAWDEISSHLAASFASVSPEVLAQPVSKGPTLDGKMSGRVAFLALHESYHLGQMGYLRKWLGFGQLVG